MNPKQAKNKINQILNSKQENLVKKIKIIAVITKILKDLNVTPVVVGGQAVEFYTVGGYSTKDIDIICNARSKEINKKLEPLGFKKEGRHWFLSGTEIAIETPAGPLGGNWDKVAEIKTEEGLTAYIIGIEDIIIDRLNSYKHWEVESDKEWIIGMIINNYEDIDWNYLKDRAKEEKVADILKDIKKEIENY